MTYSKELEQKYIEEYQKMHTDLSFLKRGFVYGYGDGKATANRIKMIGKLVKMYKATSILDYGCGKAIHHLEKKVYDSIGIHDVGLYEPAIPEFSVMPNKTFDGVVCVDVMEHVPLENVQYTMDRIVMKAKKFVFFTISCNPSKEVLSDGTNAHITIKPPEWWVEMFSKYTTPIYAVISHGDKNRMVDMVKGDWRDV